VKLEGAEVEGGEVGGGEVEGGEVGGGEVVKWKVRFFGGRASLKGKLHTINKTVAGYRSCGVGCIGRSIGRSKGRNMSRLISGLSSSSISRVICRNSWSVSIYKKIIMRNNHKTLIKKKDYKFANTGRVEDDCRPVYDPHSNHKEPARIPQRR